MSDFNKDYTYVDRDFSWLDFNSRVLDVSFDYDTPLGESAKFLGISDTNLREFMSVRFPMFCENDEKVHSVNELVDKIANFRVSQSESLKVLQETLKERYDIRILKSIKELNTIDTEYLRKAFIKLRFKQKSIVKANDVPKQEFVVCIKSSSIFGTNVHFVILRKYPKLVRIFKYTYVPIELLLEKFVNEIVPNWVYGAKHEIVPIYPILDSSIPIEKNEVMISLSVAKLISNRRKANVINLLLGNCSDEMLKILINIYQPKVVSRNLYDVDYTRYSSIRFPDEEKYIPFEPRKFFDIFERTEKGDVLLHHPYDSFVSTIDFLKDVASNSRTKSIVMTLYRLSSEDSPIVQTLCKAQTNGIQVKVLVECSARFNEEMNINIANILDSYGVEVYYGYENLKVHSKFCICTLISGDGSGKLEYVGNISTGNYNEITSRMYTDLSLFTRDESICKDLLNLFDSICSEDNVEISTSDDILYSPIDLCDEIIANIDDEIQSYRNGEDSGIFIKVNSLCDSRIVEKLNEAKFYGVPTYIICRGPCSLVAGGSVTIKSIVGRFLEHSRIFKFTKKGEPLYFIGSSDLLTRNLDKRVEILVPIYDKDVSDRLDRMIEMYKNDSKNSMYMMEDGKYEHRVPIFDVHKYFIESPDAN